MPNTVFPKITDCGVETAKKALEDSPWTIYFLIDLQLAFIFTHVYTSAINLISTTANTEATKDRQSGELFTVTDLHPNVSVTEIDDAVLWNCREHSVTKGYYKLLYLMSIIALIIGLITILIVKVMTFLKLCCKFDRYSLTKLWHLAVMQHLKVNSTHPSQGDASNSNKNKSHNTMYIELLKKDAPKEVQILTFDNILKTLIPCLLTTLMVCIMVFFFLSYDLHPLACLAEPGIDTIGYVNGTVEIRYPDSILVFQKVSYGIVLSFIIVHVLSVAFFYKRTTRIRDYMLKKYECFIKKEDAPQE